MVNPSLSTYFHNLVRHLENLKSLFFEWNATALRSWMTWCFHCLEEILKLWIIVPSLQYYLRIGNTSIDLGGKIRTIGNKICSALYTCVKYEHYSRTSDNLICNSVFACSFASMNILVSCQITSFRWCWCNRQIDIFHIFDSCWNCHLIIDFFSTGLFHFQFTVSFISYNALNYFEI